MLTLTSKVWDGKKSLLPMLVFLVFPGLGLAASGAPDEQSAGLGLTVEGISPSVGEDSPRVLYILPWQPPTLPRRERQELESRAPSLIQPVDAEALERQRVFRETLNPLTLIPGRESAVSKQ